MNVQRITCNLHTKINRGNQFKAFKQSGAAEAVITIGPNKKTRQQCVDRQLSTEPLTLRLVGVELDNEVEVLITNLLDNEHYPASEFKALYHLRWGVKENYKRLKKWIEFENFTGKSALSVKQDFHARILSSNLISMRVNGGQHQVEEQTSKRKLSYQVNFAQAISKMKYSVVELMVLLMKERLTELIEYIACTFEPIPSNRSYPRKKT